MDDKFRTTRNDIWAALIAITCAQSLGQGNTCAEETNGAGPAILVLDPAAECSLYVTATGTLNVLEGVVHVNSNHPAAICSINTPTLDVSHVRVVGGTNLSAGTVLTGELETAVSPRHDPLAWLVSPAVPALAPPPTVVAGVTMYFPGYYPNGIYLTGGTQAQAFFQPGMYYLGTPGSPPLQQRGLTVNSGSLTALGCFVYVAEGPIDIRGAATITMSPFDSGPYSQIAIFQARTNPTPATIISDFASDLSGTVYLPSAHLTFFGAGTGVGQQIIVRSLAANLNGSFTIAYSGTFGNCVPDIAPAGGDRLVGVPDLLAVINAWGPCPARCSEDITNDGDVGVPDLLAVINWWGECW